MSIAQTTFYGSGNFFYNTTAQNGVYQNHSFTSPLKWEMAYTAPTPTGVALNQPTESAAFTHTVFMGQSDGYWVHRVFLDGHLVRTFTFVDQHFSIPIQFDYIQSVAMPFSPSFGAEMKSDDPCVPSVGASAALLIGAAFASFRKRKS
jgi:hypothetical protein